jgi:hypothetical protein
MWQLLTLPHFGGDRDFLSQLGFSLRGATLPLMWGKTIEVSFPFPLSPTSIKLNYHHKYGEPLGRAILKTGFGDF